MTRVVGGGETLPRYRDVLDPGNAPDRRSAGQCVEAGCSEPAGTAWSDLWCVRHNAERMARIDTSFGALATTPVPSVSDEGLRAALERLLETAFYEDEMAFRTHNDIPMAITSRRTRSAIKLARRALSSEPPDA